MPYLDLPSGDKLFFVQEGSGKPLLFLHGFASTHYVWRKQIDHFKERNQVIALDLRGHGQSQTSAHHLTLDDLAGDVIEFIRRLRLEGVRMVGWSMGWFVAVKVFNANPHNVDAMVSVSGTPKFIKNDDFPSAISHAELRNLERKIKADHVSGIDFFYSLISEEIHKHKEYFSLPSSKITFEMLMELEKADLRKEIERIYVQTLLVHGSQDKICLPDASKYMSEHIPGSQLKIIEGAGHAPFLEKTEEFNAILEAFLRGLHG
ncbi:MAG: alpha/beta hydrolase [Candidatus Saganbacteria bacterium]|nr:alpha/beta hydrolase [Candidatus Saganbacteria bacterium]